MGARSMEKRKEYSYSQAPHPDRPAPRGWLASRPKQCVRCILGNRAMKPLGFVALALAHVTGTAADLSAQCPLHVPGASISVTAPAGWVGSVAHGMPRLAEYGMMAGAPETMTYLVPSSTKAGKNSGSSTWVFAAGDEKWVYCRYGASGLIQLTKRLDDAATSCTITRASDKRGGLTGAVVACVTSP